jgi:hypothetical protein
VCCGIEALEMLCEGRLVMDIWEPVGGLVCCSLRPPHPLYLYPHQSSTTANISSIAHRELTRQNGFTLR